MVTINKGELRLISNSLVYMINEEIIRLATNVLADPNTPSHQINHICAKITTLNSLRDRFQSWETQPKPTETKNT